MLPELLGRLGRKLVRVLRLAGGRSRHGVDRGIGVGVVDDEDASTEQGLSRSRDLRDVRFFTEALALDSEL